MMDCSDISNDPIEWTSWIGLIAFADILGGASLYLSRRAADIRKLEAYRRIVEDLYPTGPSDRVVIGFSDCIYAIQEVSILRGNTYPRQALDFLEDMSKFMTKCMANKVPIRGAIAYGEIVVFKDDIYSMLRGEPVVRAFGLEQVQKWCGIAFVPRNFVNREYRNNYRHILVKAREGGLLKRLEIPVKEGLYELDALTWHSDCAATAQQEAQDIYKFWKKKRNMRKKPERIEAAAKVLAKYPATLTFIEECRMRQP